MRQRRPASAAWAAGSGGFGLGGLSHSNSKANVGIDARLVNVDTGEILAVAEGKGQSSRSSTSMLGGGGNWHGFGGGNADFGSSDFQNTIIGEATKQAVDNLVADLVTNSSKIAVRTITVEGLVAAVDGGQIILNVGARAGVKVGDTLNVMRVTREIKDPATGAVIRRLSTNIGVVKATDVDDHRRSAFLCPEPTSRPGTRSSRSRNSSAAGTR